MGIISGLDKFFNPGSIALVGASDKPGKLSGKILESLRSSGFKGKIYPVNPAYRSVGGQECYPAIGDIKEDVDLAVVAVPAAAAVEALRQTGGKTHAAVIISGGFSEMGNDGARLEKELKDIVRLQGIRVIGPNCMGIYDSFSRLDTFFISDDRVGRPGPGSLSIISQSGSFALTAMDELAAEDVGIARVISYGNRADVNESDCLEFLADDDHTGAVAIYMESVEDGRRFVDAASRCSSKKPVIAVKVGKLGAGISAARSHTGAIAGRYEIYRAAFKKAGIIELEGYEDFIGGCKAFGMQRSAAGNRIMIITDGGGIGVGLADACASMGLDAAPLGKHLKEDMLGSFPGYVVVGNPFDLTGSVTNEMFADVLEKTMEGDYYDMAIVAPMWGPPQLTDELVDIIAKKSGVIKKPILICTPGGDYTRKRMGLFHKAGLPAFQTPESTVRAAAALSKGVRKGTRPFKAGIHG